MKNLKHIWQNIVEGFAGEKKIKGIRSWPGIKLQLYRALFALWKYPRLP